MDYETNFALGAVIEVEDGIGKKREKIIGIARFIRDPNDPTCIEVAVVVTDKWQNKGCGSQLLKNLIGIAQQKNIERITGTLLQTNTRILNMLRKSGYKIHFESYQGILSFKFSI